MGTLRQPDWPGPGRFFYAVESQLTRQVYSETMEALTRGDAARDAIRTREDLSRRQEQVRRGFIGLLGGEPRSPEPLEPVVTGVVADEECRIEKVLYQSLPGFYVTANLYLPREMDGPRPGVLLLCGHDAEGKLSRGYQQICRYLVRCGMVAMVQDPPGQGERLNYYEPSHGHTSLRSGTADHEYAGRQCLPTGYPLARYFLHDARCGISYLASRPEVLPDKIGATGASGGGTQTTMLMLGEPRLAAAAPVCFFCSRGSYLQAGGAQDAEQIWPGFTAAGFDHEDMILSMAPRPTLIVVAAGDFFPLEGAQKSVDRTRRFYEMHGAGEALQLAVLPEPHGYSFPMARAVGRFFSRHLCGIERDITPENLPSLDPKELWCTPEGKVRALPGARAVFDLNREMLEACRASRRERPQAEKLAWLRERVFRDRSEIPLQPRFYHTEKVEDFLLQGALWWSSPDIFGHGLLWRHSSRGGQNLPVTLCLWDGGTSALRRHTRTLRRLGESGRGVLVLDVRGMGTLFPLEAAQEEESTFYGIIHRTADHLFWLDDSLAARRVWDVLQALRMIEVWPGLTLEGLELFCHGYAGTYGRLARLLDERITGITVAETLESYEAWVGTRYYDHGYAKNLTLPGMLQYFDLPELED